MSDTDRIEKKILLRASRARVWAAISDSAKFGAWFGVMMDEPFFPGKRMLGKIRPTEVDPEVAALQKPHEGRRFEITIDKMEEGRLFSFRWHPFAIDDSIDYSKEPTTLVTFELEETKDGVLLTITETGFDQVPLDRRLSAFQANDAGWQHQTKLLEKYLATHAS